MGWSFAPLWKLLIDKKLKRTDLLSLANLHPQTLARMGKDEPISMDALGKICAALNCRIEDIVEFIPEQQDELKR
jgi:DNA-binding Xre family transcriptional regulator